MSHDFAGHLRAIEDSLDEIAAHDPYSAKDICSLWIDLLQLTKVLKSVVDGIEVEATEALHSEIGDDSRGRPITGKHSILDTPAGPVHLQLGPIRRKFHGRAIARALAEPMIVEGTGEKVHAVLYDILCDVLPAAHSEDPTSYGWRTRELRDVLGDEFYKLVDETTAAEDRGVVISAQEFFPR